MFRDSLRLAIFRLTIAVLIIGFSNHCGLCDTGFAIFQRVNGNPRQASNSRAIGPQVTPRIYSGCQQVHYFSGTNEEWICGMWTAQGLTIADCQITLNGTAAYQWSNQFETCVVNTCKTPGLTYWTTHFVFDSTHYQNGTELYLKVSGHTSDGQLCTCQVAATVINRCLALSHVWRVFNDPDVYGSSEFVDGAGTVANIQREWSPNYYVLADSTLSAAQITAALPKYQVFYMFTHGNTDNFVECLGKNSIAFLNHNDKYNIESSVGSKTQMDPPFSFVNMDSCWSGGDDRVAGSGGYSYDGRDAFFPVRNRDMCYMGWRNEVNVFYTRTFFERNVMQRLMRGQTVGDAIYCSYLLGLGMHANHVEYIDTKTKIHGIYGQPSQLSFGDPNKLEWVKVYE